MPDSNSAEERWTLMPGGHFRGPEFEGESMEVVPTSEVERLRSGIEDYLLWEPGRRGHAEAHRRLAALLHPDEGQT